jgi:hypothetical protein
MLEKMDCQWADAAKYATSMLVDLSQRFGLSHPDSALDLVKRGRKSLDSNSHVRSKVRRIENV